MKRITKQFFKNSFPTKLKYKLVLVGNNMFNAEETWKSTSNCRRHSPVNNSLSLQILQTTAQLCSIENSPFFIKARISHVIYVKLQIPSIHYG